jgi:hypothetical protein
VQHQARKYGETKFGMERFKWIPGFNYHLVSFTIWKRPMHLFGAMGSLMFIIGFISGLYWRFKTIPYVYEHAL